MGKFVGPGIIRASPDALSASIAMAFAEEMVFNLAGDELGLSLFKLVLKAMQNTLVLCNLCAARRGGNLLGVPRPSGT